jgi:hypothetical protein
MRIRMFSYLKTSSLTLLLAAISFTLLAGEVKTSNKIPIKTKQGKAVLTKKGIPICIKKKGK